MSLRISDRRLVIRSASRSEPQQVDLTSRFWDDLEETNELHPFLMTVVGGLLIPLLLTALVFFVIF